MIRKIDEELLNEVILEARKRDRKRANYNFHSTYDDPVNRMLNAFEQGTYIQPTNMKPRIKEKFFYCSKGNWLWCFLMMKVRLPNM